MNNRFLKKFFIIFVEFWWFCISFKYEVNYLIFGYRDLQLKKDLKRHQKCSSCPDCRTQEVEEFTFTWTFKTNRNHLSLLP